MSGFFVFHFRFLLRCDAFLFLGFGDLVLCFFLGAFSCRPAVLAVLCLSLSLPCSFQVSLRCSAASTLARALVSLWLSCSTLPLGPSRTKLSIAACTITSSSACLLSLLLLFSFTRSLDAFLEAVRLSLCLRLRLRLWLVCSVFLLHLPLSLLSTLSPLSTLSTLSIGFVHHRLLGSLCRLLGGKYMCYV